MSAKRFKLSSETVLQYQIMDNDTDLNENEVCDLLNEQQATIRRLQDLCGESDSENAKLRIENEQLRKELGDCEKFRYAVFKKIGELSNE